MRGVGPWAVVCLLGGLSARAVAHEAVGRPIADRSIVLPAARSDAQNHVLYLHGMCGLAENGCGYFRAGTESLGPLLCPKANAPCSGGGASWAKAGREAHLASQGADLGGGGNVIIGFSQGAFVALDWLRERPKRYASVVLIGAFVETSREELREAGVQRIVLAAGTGDASFRHMRKLADRLAGGALEARFVSLGAVGHTYVPERGIAWRPVLEWVSQTGHAQTESREASSAWEATR